MATPTTFLDHIRELRRRLWISACAVLIGMIASFLLYDPLLAILVKPFSPMNSSISQTQFFVTSLFEGFVTKMKFSCVGGFVLSFPVHVFQILRFILPGLKPKEKRLILSLLVFSVLLAVGSLWLVYTIVLPISIQFMTQSNFIPQNVGILLSFKSNVFYVFNFLLWSMIVFQFPILLLGLLYTKILSRKTLLKGSRLVIVIVFVVAAFVTPPDAVSQVSLALPMVALYFLTIGIAKVFRLGADE